MYGYGIDDEEDDDLNEIKRLQEERKRKKLKNDDDDKYDTAIATNKKEKKKQKSTSSSYEDEYRANIKKEFDSYSVSKSILQSLPIDEDDDPIKQYRAPTVAEQEDEYRSRWRKRGLEPINDYDPFTGKGSNKGGSKIGDSVDIKIQEPITFGRDPTKNKIILEHPSCSSSHASITLQQSGKRPILLDLKSTNQTFLNNKEIEPYHPQELYEGDKIKFGASSREYIIYHT
eukprot:gene6207-7729_t